MGNAGMVPKSLGELISHYHDSVGRNAFMLLDWTPTQDGTMRQDHLQRYQEFGNWLSDCYAAPVVAVDAPLGTTAVLKIPADAEVDRIVIEENLIAGEHILSYNVTLDGQLVTNGTSVGHKRIDFLEGGSLKGTELILTVDGYDGASLARVAAHNCSRIPGATGCDFLQDFAYTVYDDITIQTLKRSTPAQCCDACRANSECAVFLLDANSLCTLLSMKHGGTGKKGF